jgi:hypothetical protein
MELGRQVMPLKMTFTPRFFDLIASAIPKWRAFKLLRWLQINPLITFEPIGGLG